MRDKFPLYSSITGLSLFPPKKFTGGNRHDENLSTGHNANSHREALSFFVFCYAHEATKTQCTVSSQNDYFPNCTSTTSSRKKRSYLFYIRIILAAHPETEVLLVYPQSGTCPWSCTCCPSLVGDAIVGHL